MEVAHYLWKKYGSSHRVLFISVPFEEVVGEILQKVDNSQMGVVLKRMMLRASTEIAERLHIDALVTGEAISQVSSQTLPNLSVIDSATDMLVLRPLIASHKQDIIDTAFQIGTAEFAKNMPEYCGVISRTPPPAPSAIASSTRKSSSTWPSSSALWPVPVRYRSTG